MPMAKTGFARPAQQGAEGRRPKVFRADALFSKGGEGMRRQRWTKADKLEMLLFACILLGWMQASNAYQGCIAFGIFASFAFLILLAGTSMVKSYGARKSVLACIVLACLLECAALYAALPADTYAEGRARMEERWLAGYGNVELMGETRDYIGYFTGYETDSTAQRFFHKIAGRSDGPVLRRRPYVYIFGADKDIIACIYDPFSGQSRIGTLKNARNTDWKKLLVMGGYPWTEG